MRGAASRAPLLSASIGRRYTASNIASIFAADSIWPFFLATLTTLPPHSAAASRCSCVPWCEGEVKAQSGNGD